MVGSKRKKTDEIELDDDDKQQKRGRPPLNEPKKDESSSDDEMATTKLNNIDVIDGEMNACLDTEEDDE